MPGTSFRNTFVAWPTISGPIPSPGRTATFIGSSSSEIPGVPRLALLLEGADLVRVAQREADLVEAVQEAVLAERVDVEAEAFRTIGGRDRLLFQIHYYFETGKRRGLVEKLVDLGFRQGDG